MSRPLMQNSISELEKMFSTSPSDLEVLGRLEGELKFRQTQRAGVLFEKVKKALSGTAFKSTVPSSTRGPMPKESQSSKPTPLRTSSATIKTPQAQPELWPVAEPTTVGKPIGPQPVRRAAAPVAAVASAPVVTRERSPLPKIDQAEAYKLLGAEPTTRWEILEDRRRKLVHQAHPDNLLRLEAGKRSEALAAARKINAAYAMLLQLRIASKA